MNRLPTLRQLHHLVALYEHQHFGRAANACFVSQSSLSVSIAHLEEALDAPLLERDHKTFLFTPLGEDVVRRARIILQECDDLSEHARSQGEPMRGNLRLACIPTIAPFILQDLLTRCRRVYPYLNVLIREDTTDNALAWLAEGRLDLVILALPYAMSGMTTRIVARDRFHLVLPAAWANKGFDKDMSNWPDHSLFLLEKEHCLTGHALQACQLRDGKKIHPFYATSLHTLTHMVGSDMGMTFLPELAIAKGILKGTSLVTSPVVSHDAWREIGVVWRSSSLKQPACQLVADLLENVLSDILNSKSEDTQSK